MTGSSFALASFVIVLPLAAGASLFYKDSFFFSKKPLKNDCPSNAQWLNLIREPYAFFSLKHV